MEKTMLVRIMLALMSWQKMCMIPEKKCSTLVVFSNTATGMQYP